MILTASDEAHLLTWRRQLTELPRLRLARNQRPESGPLAAFLDDWQRLLPGAAVQTEEIAATELPAILVGETWRFHAVPSGSKLQVFTDILLALNGRPVPLPPVLAEGWGRLPLAPALTIFVAPHCPHCPQMVRQLIPLTLARPAALVSVIDAELCGAEARREQIKAVPTLIINGIYRLTGAFQLTELLDLAAKTDPAHLPTPVLERLLQEGQAGVVGEAMLAAGTVGANFLPLLWHPEINIRLGAMVALETVGGARPDLVAALLPALWQQMGQSETAVQGDLVYLIGQWGDASWLAPLEQARRSAVDADVVEATEEAMATIRERSG